MAEGERDDRPDSGAKARGGLASARVYRHLVDEWKRVFARYQPELNQELLRLAGRPLTDADIDAAAAVLAMSDVRAPTGLPPRLQGHMAGSVMETAVAGAAHERRLCSGAGSRPWADYPGPRSPRRGRNSSPPRGDSGVPPSSSRTMHTSTSKPGRRALVKPFGSSSYKTTSGYWAAHCPCSSCPRGTRNAWSKP